MQTPNSSATFNRTEFLVMSKNSELLAVSTEIAVYFSFRAEFAESLDLIAEETRLLSSPLVCLLSLEELPDTQEQTAKLRELVELFPRSQNVLVLSGIETEADREALRAAGAHHLLSLQEVMESSKLFYLSALLVQGTYLPVQVTDFFPSTQLSFNAYHKLPLNQKFLPVIFSGFPFSDKKYRKLEPSKQVYILREDLNEYRKYIETYHDRTGAALKKRCRAVLMTLMGIHSEIILLLSLDAEENQKALTAEKITQFVKIAEELGDYLKDCPDVWNVIAQALDFKFCRLERGPYIVAYSIFISMKSGLGDLKDVILTALLSDLGILELPFECYKTLQKSGENYLTAEDRPIFRNHPLSSVNRLVVREVEVSDQVKSAIACTHERHDGEGFPSQTPAANIPVEAKIIHFCEIMDRRVRANLEDGIMTHDFVRKQVWEEEKDSLKRFDAEFLTKIEKVLIA